MKKQGRPCSLPSPWLDLVNALGSVAQTAATLRCEPSTLYRWAHGKQIPSRAARVLISATFKAYKIEEPTFF